MKFAVSYSTPAYGVDPDRLVAFARHAEACGFEGLYVPEHVVLYRGATFGGFELPTTLPYGDPLELLTFVAAATERILLGTAVLLLPYHHSVVLAKRLATIDALSKGRMRLLWTGGPDGVSYSGEFFEFEDLASFPQPLAPLPIHIGGSSRAAARRGGLRGDGYFPGGALAPAERKGQWDLARRTSARDDLEYTRWASIDLTPSPSMPTQPKASPASSSPPQTPTT